MSLNKVMLIGNVGKDPEVRYLGETGNGKVARFPLATTERYKDRNGTSREVTEWHSVTAWRATADFVEKYVRKGSLLYVEGQIHYNTWSDKGGNVRYSCEISADNLQLLGKRADAQDGQAGRAQDTAPAGRRETPDSPGISDIEDDDLPF